MKTSLLVTLLIASIESCKIDGQCCLGTCYQIKDQVSCQGDFGVLCGSGCCPPDSVCDSKTLTCKMSPDSIGFIPRTIKPPVQVQKDYTEENFDCLEAIQSIQTDLQGILNDFYEGKSQVTQNLKKVISIVDRISKNCI